MNFGKEVLKKDVLIEGMNNLLPLFLLSFILHLNSGFLNLAWFHLEVCSKDKVKTTAIISFGDTAESWAFLHASSDLRSDAHLHKILSTFLIDIYAKQKKLLYFEM
ncbi:hypothetical protein E2320_009839 [Naja naja]|nr:hypothetical protein E2320_009839 [Naja naja]